MYEELGFFGGSPNLCSPSNWDLDPTSCWEATGSNWKKWLEKKSSAQSSLYGLMLRSGGHQGCTGFPVRTCSFSTVACLFLFIPVLASFTGLNILLFLKVLVFFQSFKPRELISSDFRSTAEKQPFRAIKRSCVLWQTSYLYCNLKIFSLWFNASYSRRQQ